VQKIKIMENILNLGHPNESFGYAYPELVLNSIFNGVDGFSLYVERANKAINGFNHFCLRKGIVYPLTKEGVSECIKDTYGVAKILEYYIGKDADINVEWVQKLGSLDTVGTLLPTIIVDGQMYIVPEDGGTTRYVGDNVCLTGGSKPKCYGETKGFSVPYYCETFNAGNGRVTAGIDGKFYFKEGLKTLIACKPYN